MKDDRINQIVETLSQVMRLMKKEISFTDTLKHLSMLQIQTIIYLYNNANVSMGDIAGHFRVEMPSATSLLNKLFDQKLVERRDDPTDRRVVKVSLTGEGKILAKKAMAERRNHMKKMLSYLSVKEQSGLLEIMRSLQNRLQEE